jgi:hypothetical protein
MGMSEPGQEKDGEWREGDPEYMTLEEDGQEAFDAMWQEGDTITSDGYYSSS